MSENIDLDGFLQGQASPEQSEISDPNEEPEFPSLSENMRIYLKPMTQKRTCCHFLLLMLDFFLSASFIPMQWYYLHTNNFHCTNDKVLQALIGAGSLSLAILYAIFDGSRFLKSKCDILLYFFSCILQKPILFPILLPFRFKSSPADSRFSG